MENVVLAWKKPPARAFTEIVVSYVPPPAIIVDLMAGERQFYKFLNNGNTLDGKKYTFIFGDIRPLPGLHYIGDMLDYQGENVADAFVFDPPWPSSSGVMEHINERNYRPMSVEEFIEFLPKALRKAQSLLKVKGVLIVKASHPWNHVIYQQTINMEFEYIREIVQIMCTTNIRTASYYMLFRRK